MTLTKFVSVCSIIVFFYIMLMGISKASNNYYIGLQNLRSRTVVYCYDNEQTTAEQCASYYETQGYTRFRDIPSRTAKYDFLTVDTYPTRRWRNGELSPRW
ncbi:MAG: hypothetical protein IKC10_05295 [Alphaproteobacteria bacterium]|nr:hypothetical protein [Alphaproteobacteria bacterium]